MLVFILSIRVIIANLQAHLNFIQMKLYPIETGNFKLDGGAMFGVVPKTIWNKTNPADENNLIDIAARCLLIEDGNRLILIDTGMGNKQSDKFFGYYSLWGTHSMDKSLAHCGFHRDDITDVFMTHLHFDHCGGSVQWNKDKTGYEPAFKNAKFWSNENHWEWATKPNAREKASFLKENIEPMQQSGHLNFVPIGTSPFAQFDILFSSGHTDQMMIPKIRYNGKTVCYMADLLPSVGHIPLPYVMAYDSKPLITMVEKEKFLNEAVDNNYVLFFEHDPIH